MAEIFSNDNGTYPEPLHGEPDAHGQAALLLVESVLHGLIEQSVFTVEKAVALIDIAREVNRDIGADRGDSPATLQKSSMLLAAISTSLQGELRS